MPVHSMPSDILVKFTFKNFYYEPLKIVPDKHYRSNRKWQFAACQECEQNNSFDVY